MAVIAASTENSVINYTMKILGNVVGNKTPEVQRQEEIDMLLQDIKARKQLNDPHLNNDIATLEQSRNDKKDSIRSIRDGLSIGVAASAFGDSSAVTFMAVAAGAIDGYARGGWKDAALGAVAAYAGKSLGDAMGDSLLGKALTSAGIWGVGKLTENFLADELGPTNKQINNMKQESSKMELLGALQDSLKANPESSATLQQQFGSFQTNDFNGMMAKEILLKQVEQSPEATSTQTIGLKR